METNNNILQMLIELFVVIFVPTFGTLIVAGLAKLLTHFNLKNAAQILANNEQLVINAIAFVANKKAKSLKFDGIKIPKEEQLRDAVEYILTRNPKITPQEAEEWVETVLPKVQEGASATLTLAKEKLQEIQK